MALDPDTLRCETLDDFREQVCKFFTHLGDRAVMTQRDRRKALMLGLTIIWLRLGFDGEDKAEAHRLFRLSVAEYSDRSSRFSKLKMAS